ncbi:putative NADH dehydrogenase [ubiquinone] 1 beta subcomplex subunit 8, mitochondrial [Cocos nucifera]|uniref:Putative NADH dehydrogenase [ubiquinone] 1 beta subcomplex subunit 8, mitochondrial n=1 Tax=Cocos nucifera TaxID=13894 RepID=A0A8K0N893_COCNU|nr:putative NADH dehydrogenase [ubiquinone] 1 beta subcomplex subunit 8, mitochondrial [Cocos nucifera]
MAGRLSSVGSRIMGGNGVVGQSLASSLRNHSSVGLPVGKHIVPDKPYEALGWLCGGLGFIATLGLLAAWNDKASKIPYVSTLFFPLFLMDTIHSIFFSLYALKSYLDVQNITYF